MGNKALLELARSGPETLQGMNGIEGLSPRQIERYGTKLLQALARGQEIPAEQLPIYPRQARRDKDPEAEKRFKKLKQWRLDKASELQLDPGVLINNAMLETIARINPETAQDLGEIESMKNWQKQILGQGLVQCLKR